MKLSELKASGADVQLVSRPAPAAPVTDSLLSGGSQPMSLSGLKKAGKTVLPATDSPQTPGMASPRQEDPTAGSSSGLMTGPLSLLAVPGQLAAKTMASVGTKAPQEAIAKTAEDWQKYSERLGKMAEVENDPIQKKKLLSMQMKAAEQVRQAAGYNTGMQQRNLEAQKIDTPVGDIPALSDSPARAAQQVVGRGAQTTALMASGIGGTASGALFGFGEGMEAGDDAKTIAMKTGAYAVGGKFLSFLGGTSAGKKVLGTKPFQLLGKALSPLMTKPAEEFATKGLGQALNKGAGVAVDKAAAAAGEFADNIIMSPTAWLRGAEKVGQKAGVLATDAEKLAVAEKKLVQKYRDALGITQRQAQLEYKQGKDIGEIMMREGIPLESYKEAGKIRIDTSKGQDLLKANTKLQNAAFNGVLKDSGATVNFDRFGADWKAAIARNFSGKQQAAALAAADAELAAWRQQLAGAAVEGKNGLMVPADQFNRVKQYFWQQTPGFKTPDAILADDVNYLGGNVAMRAIEGAVPDTAVRGMNQYLGDLAFAQRILAQRNGAVAAGGAMGKYFARTLGAIAGHGIGGPVGTFAGAVTSERIAEVLASPEFKMANTSALIKKLRQTLGKGAEDVVDQAAVILERRAAERAARMRLGSPNPGASGPAIELPASMEKDLMGMRSPVIIPPGASPEVVDEAYTAIMKNGGVTINLQGGKPTEGFVFSPSKATETIMPTAQFNKKDIDKFAETWYNELTQDGAHIGGWIDGDKVYLDVSRVVPDEQVAIEAAKKSNQLGIYDIKTGQTKFISGPQAAQQEAGLHDINQGQVPGAGQSGALPSSPEGGPVEGLISKKGSTPPMAARAPKSTKVPLVDKKVARALGEKTEYWLDNWGQEWLTKKQLGPDFADAVARAKPTRQVIDELSVFKPDGPVKLYRGVKPGGEPRADITGYESWTYDKNVAKEFAGDGGKVVSRTVSPDEVLVDFTKMPKEVRAKSMGGLNQDMLDKEQEVIVRAARAAE